jgi:hypothetical protein
MPTDAFKREIEVFISRYTEPEDVKSLVSLLDRLDISSVPKNTYSKQPGSDYLRHVIESHVLPTGCSGKWLNPLIHFPLLGSCDSVEEINDTLRHLFKVGDDKLVELTGSCYIDHCRGVVEDVRERAGTPVGFAMVEFAHRLGSPYLVPEDVLVVRRGVMPTHPRHDILTYNVRIPYISVMHNAYLCLMGNTTDSDNKYILPTVDFDAVGQRQTVHVIRVIAASETVVQKLRMELEQAIAHQLTEISDVLAHPNGCAPVYSTPLGGVALL